MLLIIVVVRVIRMLGGPADVVGVVFGGTLGESREHDDSQNGFAETVQQRIAPAGLPEPRHAERILAHDFDSELCCIVCVWSHMLFVVLYGCVCEEVMRIDAHGAPT